MFPTRRLVVPLALVALAMVMSATAGCERIETFIHGDRCVFSDRVIVPGMAVRVAVEGGPSGKACCVRCAISYSLQTGKTVRILWVTDYSTHKRIAAGRAYYVTGSDVAPCVGSPAEASAGRRECVVLGWDRCAPSSLPFATMDEARAFQRAHGGRIQTFAEVVGSAKVVAAR
jgi:nitrous oxide reductase accessory protein NosL